jgi:hypothetical protein
METAPLAFTGSKGSGRFLDLVDNGDNGGFGMTLRELIERLQMIDLWNVHAVADAPVFICLGGETERLGDIGVEELMVCSLVDGKETVEMARPCVILSPTTPTKVSGIEDAV